MPDPVCPTCLCPEPARVEDDWGNLGFCGDPWHKTHDLRPPLTTEQLRDVALRAKARYERMTSLEDWEEPTSEYQAWLLSLGFTSEEVAHWRSSLSPVEAALVQCARALSFSFAGSERPADDEPEQQALWDAMHAAHDALQVSDTREYRPAPIRLQDVTDRALLVELQRRLAARGSS